MEIIAVASDHAGFEMKKAVIEHLKLKGYSVKDFGCYSVESCDYPDYAHPLAQAMERGEHKRAVVFCGSGNVTITDDADICHDCGYVYT